jgi:hypothetical protein
VTHPDSADPVGRLLWRIAGGFEAGPCGSMRVVNAASTWEKLRSLGWSSADARPDPRTLRLLCARAFACSPQASPLSLSKRREESPAPLPWWFSEVDHV